MKIQHKILLLVSLVFLAFPATAFTAEIVFDDVAVVDQKVRVNLSVKGYQRKDILEAIKRGIEVRIVYEIQVVREAGFFLLGDSVAYDKTVMRSVKYDFWNKAFQVREGQRKTMFQSERSMIDYFFSVRNYDLIDTDFMKQAEYSLRARAELRTVELYFPMNLIFKYFVKYWDFKTRWSIAPPLEF